ncbi:MAG: ThuA domain-containing protein [Planctomycetota bacterium]
MKKIPILALLLIALMTCHSITYATELSEGFVKEFNAGFDRAMKPNPELVEKAREIVERIPLKVQPKKKRKVLIYGISWGPHRVGMLTAVETLKMIGEETGAFESVISLDLANFEPEALKQFDAVIFPNSTGDVFVRPVAKNAIKELPDEEQKRQLANANRLANNLVEFVENGGGFLGTHGATDCNMKIPEYISMVGGAFYGHPWGPNHTVTITVDSPDHGLTQGIFNNEEFPFNDEIYEFNRFSKERVRVLLSLNIEKSDPPGKPMKTDYVPIAWVKKQGQGRVFFSSLVHAEKTWSDEQFLKFLIPALQYAKGDYLVDDSLQ